MLFDANNSKSFEADMVDEAEIDIKMAEIRSEEEDDARRHCGSSNLKKKTAENTTFCY